MKKVVIFGGGTGLSQLLKGLKEFPIDVTAIVTVADNGRSTGKLRNEFNIPIKYVGLGEKLDDLEQFDIEQYLYGLFADFFE